MSEKKGLGVEAKMVSELLCAEIGELEAENARLLADNAEKTEKLKVAVEALEQYENKLNWEWSDHAQFDCFLLSSTAINGYDIADAALKIINTDPADAREGETR